MAKQLITDELWAAVEPLLPPEPAKARGGRPRIPNRDVPRGILFVLSTGLPWEYLPPEMGCGSGMTCRRRPREWREAVRAAGARLLYLPPYSPDLNPIEQCWSKLKAGLRKAKARTREALGAALGEAFAAVTEQDAKSWFRHCGYALR